MSETKANNRSNQVKRGLSANQENIRPKLTKEQRATMSIEEKAEYAKQRLKEYRKEYAKLYEKQVVYVDEVMKTYAIARSLNWRSKKRTKDAELKAFYEKYKDVVA